MRAREDDRSARAARCVSAHRGAVTGAVHGGHHFYMAQVEDRMREIVNQPDDDLDSVWPLDVVLSGGKRKRAAFILAFSSQDGHPDDTTIQSAALVELLHCASLLHDDVIDAAAVRRGHISLNARFGNSAAILAGDLLLADISLRVAEIEQQRHDDGISSLGLARCLAAALRGLVVGQAMELESVHDRHRGLEHYFETIALKTGALFSLAAGLGARLCSSTVCSVEDAECFGREYGRAFQMIDDLLDVASDPVVLGKPTMNDVRSGVYTLPVLLGLQQSERVRDVLSAGCLDADGLVRELHRSGAIRQAVVLCRESIESARRSVHETLRPECLKSWCLRAADELEITLDFVW